MNNEVCPEVSLFIMENKKWRESHLLLGKSITGVPWSYSSKFLTHTPSKFLSSTEQNLDCRGSRPKFWDQTDESPGDREVIWSVGDPLDKAGGG